MAKAKALGSIAPTQTESDSLAAKNMFAKDPTSKIQSLDSERTKLTAGAKVLHAWLTKTLNQFLLYNSKRILAPDIKALITKRIRLDVISKTKDSWEKLSTWIRKQLRDMSPRYMLESITSMARPSNMPVVFWTNAFIMLRNQLLLKGQTLSNSIAYDYWGEQVTISEWGVVTDFFDIPKSLEDKEKFDIKAFLTAANSVAVSAFKTFNLRDSENAHIRAFQATLLVKPSSVIKRSYPKYSPHGKITTTSTKPVTHKNAQPMHVTNPSANYFCAECGISHGQNQHTEAGKKLFRERNRLKKLGGFVPSGG